MRATVRVEAGTREAMVEPREAAPMRGREVKEAVEAMLAALAEAEDPTGPVVAEVEAVTAEAAAAVMAGAVAEEVVAEALAAAADVMEA